MQRDLRKVKRVLDKKLKKQTQEGLGKYFDMVGCNGVAKEIRAGRRVEDNVAYGFRVCVHPKTGPRINPSTGQFYPQTKRAKYLEEAMLVRLNKLLENGGFKPLPKNLLPSIRKKDKGFEKQMKKRFGAQFMVVAEK